jgi:protein-S-isoprenylcysteine O-methyltransferase Ste14
MHPIMSELFTKPVGWMTLGGIAFMLFMALYLWLYARKKMREEERGS